MFLSTFFWHFITSLHPLQLLKRILQHCFSLMLQKCGPSKFPSDIPGMKTYDQCNTFSKMVDLNTNFVTLSWNGGTLMFEIPLYAWCSAPWITLAVNSAIHTNWSCLDKLLDMVLMLIRGANEKQWKTSNTMWYDTLVTGFTLKAPPLKSVFCLSLLQLEAWPSVCRRMTVQS